MYAVLTAPSYTNTYAEELKSKAVRVPVTLDHELFVKASGLGSELIYLHTYGAVLGDGRSWPRGMTRYLKPIGATHLPGTASYDIANCQIVVGDGAFGPVSQQVWDFDISGFKVVQSWLNSRKETRVGRSSSPLDDIRPLAWTSSFTEEFLDLLNVLQITVNLREAQAQLLREIAIGPMLLASDLGAIPNTMRKAPVMSRDQHNLNLE